MSIGLELAKKIGSCEMPCQAPYCFSIEVRDKLGEVVDAKDEVIRLRNELVYLRNDALIQGNMVIAVFLSHAISPLSQLLGIGVKDEPS